MAETKEFMLISLFPYCLLALLALAATVFADTGQYNYGVSILNNASNYSIGTDMNINAYISYANSAIAEYPCILTFKDYADNSTLFSKRVYTDELGQFFYKSPVTDLFENNKTYTYFIQCSNTTSNGTILVTTNTRHTFIPNALKWGTENISYLTALGGFLFVLIVVFLAKGRK